MTNEEKAQKIEEIYNEAMIKLKELGALRKDAIDKYIKKLEDQKVDAIRASLELSFKKE